MFQSRNGRGQLEPGTLNFERLFSPASSEAHSSAYSVSPLFLCAWLIWASLMFYVKASSASSSPSIVGLERRVGRCAP